MVQRPAAEHCAICTAGGDFRRGNTSGSSAGDPEGLHRTVVVDHGIFRTQAPPAHNRRTYQCHKTCDGPGGRDAPLRRKTQRLPVDRRTAFHRFHIYDESRRQEGKHCIHTEQMGVVRSRCHHNGSDQRTLRQVHHEVA